MRELARAALLLLKHGRSPGLLRRLLGMAELLGRAYREGGTDALAMLARYIVQVAGERVTMEQLGHVLALAAGEEGRYAVGTLAERLVREGQADMLLRLLRSRFGDVPPAVEERVRAARQPDLDRWADRVLFAESIESVLDGPDPA